jgi:preprotein translocase subunit SecD
MRRRKLTPLVFIVLLAVVSLGVVLATGTSPQLGLDLQGGVSVVLEPTEDVSDDALSQTIEIIRSRVDALGVAEPEITRQGDSVVVQLPGVKNQQRALELVGATAELRFRPVLQDLGSYAALQAAATSTTAADGSTTTTAPDGESTTTTAAGESTTTTTAAETTTTTATDGTSTTAADGDTTTTTAGEPAGVELTPRDEDLPEATVILASEDENGDPEEVYELGPAQATGRIVKTARARLNPNGTWSVALEMRGGESGIDQFNDIAAQCSPPSETCPTGRLAIVLDSVVKSAPTIQAPSFAADDIAITGEFTESDAKDLALVLRYGSLPVTLEPQTVQTVSPTLGEDSLRAGLAAGLVGVALVVLYMILY